MGSACSFPSISMPTQTLNTLIELAQHCESMLGGAHVWYLTFCWEEHHLEASLSPYMQFNQLASLVPLFYRTVPFLIMFILLNLLMETGLIDGEDLQSCCFHGHCLPYIISNHLPIATSYH